MLMCMYLHELYKMKPVFIYCRFNISCIRKIILKTKNFFAYFHNALAYHIPKVFSLSRDFLINLYLSAYYDLYGH